MSDLPDKQSKGRELSDAELGEVSGGYGTWDNEKNWELMDAFRNSGEKDLDAYLRKRCSAEELRARSAWYAAECPGGKRFVYREGVMTVEPYGGMGL